MAVGRADKFGRMVGMRASKVADKFEDGSSWGR